MDNKFEELKKACEPVIEYLRNNYDPHTHAVVSCDKVVIYQETIGLPIKYEDQTLLYGCILSNLDRAEPRDGEFIKLWYSDCDTP